MNDVEGENVEVARYYWPLCTAIERNDWKSVRDFINSDPNALTATISKDLETIFHKMACSDDSLELMEEFVSRMSPELLEQADSNGDTALCNAATVGNTKAAKILVNRNKKLVNICNSHELLPLHLAAVYGHKDTVEYLLSVTDEDLMSHFQGRSGCFLLESLITSNLYGLAFDLMKKYPKLARDDISYRVTILQRLARKPRAFASGTRHGYWNELIYKYTPVKELDDSLSSRTTKGERSQKYTNFGAFYHKLHFMLWDALMRIDPIKHIHDTKLENLQALQIVRMMCADVIWSFGEASESLKASIHSAASLGIYEFVDEVLKAYLYSFLLVDKDSNNIFMLAVLHRKEKVFSLINRLGMLKDMALTTYRDRSRNNILHLAGRLGPSSHVRGAALQMQRELQWFKAVETFVHPSLHEEENESGNTPRDVFTKEHKDLVKEGEQWMKENATSCTVVAALIVTVVFAAAFTVPGGNNSGGIPLFLHKPTFIVFIIADALALFSSTASVLMFLGILTLHYSEEDFMESLPRKLIIGFVTLFVSIASMLVAFGAVIYMVLSDLWASIFIPMVILGGLTVILFAGLQFPLLADVYLSTYRSSILRLIKSKDI